MLARTGDKEKSKYLSDLLHNLYIKDVIERNKLQGDVIMESIVDILASAVGSLTNPPKLANTFSSNQLKTNANTISAYIEHLRNAFILDRAERYDVKGKKYISSPYKYYFTDIGIRNSKLNFRQQEQTHIMENIIYNELVMRGYNVDVGVVDYFATDDKGKRVLIHSEVDFVCNMGSQRYYIQSAFSIPDEEKMKQEQASLDHIGDSFKKIIIVQDHIKAWRNEKGYLIMNIFVSCLMKIVLINNILFLFNAKGACLWMTNNLSKQWNSFFRLLRSVDTIHIHRYMVILKRMTLHILLVTIMQEN